MKEGIAEFWDGTLKDKLAEICNHPDIDEPSKYYISQAAFYVEHDLADGRDPRFRLVATNGVLHDESFIDIFSEELKPLLREAAELVEKFMVM